MNRWVLIALGVVAIVVAWILLRRQQGNPRIIVPEAHGFIPGPGGELEPVTRAAINTTKFKSIDTNFLQKPAPLQDQTPIGGGAFVKSGVLR